MANVLAWRNTFLVQVCTRTFPPAAHISTVKLQFTCIIAMGRLTVFRFANLWTHRTQCVSCVHGMVEACCAIAVDWCAPCELLAGSATFNFSSVQEFKRATSERACQI